MNRIKSSPEKQNAWREKRDDKLEKAYSSIAYGIPLVDVRNKEAFYISCRDYFTELTEVNPSVNEIERWDAFEIDRMFGKGLNPTSLKSAFNNIQYCVNNITTDDEYIRVLEFGPGSGWSTLMLYNSLIKKFPDKKVQLVSVDISPHSIAATQNSLDYYQIPWQTFLEVHDISSVPDSYDRVNLVLGDFIKFAENQPDNYFNGFFSSHGTAYLSKSQYEKLLRVLTAKGKDKSVFTVDSLDPLCSVELSTLHLLKCSINPKAAEKMEEYTYGKPTKSNSKYFTGQSVKKLIKVNNTESLLFYRWNNYLLRQMKIMYLIHMMKSIKITTEIINEYLEDVYPSYLIKTLDTSTKKGAWKELEDLPSTPLYISNAGFILDSYD